MARRKRIGIRSQLKGLIAGDLLSNLARQSGFVKRVRTTDPAKSLRRENSGWGPLGGSAVGVVPVSTGGMRKMLPVLGLQGVRLPC